MKSSLVLAVALVVAAVGLGVSGASAPARAQVDALVERTSPHSVDDTRRKLEAAITNAGGTVFATVDHAAGAKTIGTALESMVLVIFGNPRIGTPIIAAAPLAGLDLPIRVLIWSDGTTTRLAALSPDALKSRYAISGADDAIAAMASAIDRLMGAATAP